jgi:hypothetical protein
MTDELQLSQTIEAHAPAEYIEVALTAAMQRIAELEAVLAYIDAHAPLADATCNKPKINPAVLFEQTSSHVSSETQRINAPENANAVRKSFIQILVEQVMNLLPIAIEPHLNGVFTQMNQAPNGNQNFSYKTFTPSPCEIRTMCAGNDEEMKTKTSFINALLNSVLAFLLSVLLQRLIKELKSLIKKYLLQKAQDRLRRKLEKQKRMFNNAMSIGDAALEKAEKAKKFADATASLDDVFKYTDS